MERVEERANMYIVTPRVQNGPAARVAVQPIDLGPPTMTVSAPLLFSTFEVTRQAFYRTALSYAIVNLKPIVPGRESHSLPHTPTHSTTVRRSGHAHTCRTEADGPHNARINVPHEFRPTRRSCH